MLKGHPGGRVGKQAQFSGHLPGSATNYTGLRFDRSAAIILGFFALIIGLFFRIALDRYLEDLAAFIFFIPGVVAASIGGKWPGIFLALTGAAGGLAVETVTSAVTLGDAVALAVFLSISVVIASGGERVRSARLREFATNADLTRRQAHLTSILKTVPSAMIVIDSAGNIQDFSDAATHLFGWTSAEAVGQNVKLLMPSPARDSHDDYLRRYLSTGQSEIIGKSTVVSGQRKDGSTFPMEIWIGEMALTDGMFFTGFARDLTERRAADARLQELQSELFHMSRLTALGEMASALAHELNQPLSAISNYVMGSKRLLEREPEAPENVLNALNSAAKETERAGAIIRRLRDFVSHGEIDRSLEDLTALIKEAGTLASIGTKEQDVKITFEFAADLDPVLVDKVQIQQVFMNLIRNATDAMSNSKERRLRVLTAWHSPTMALVSVHDTGEGIADSVSQRLFQPFVTTKRAGMGVGLSICRTIIEAHGGRIWAEAQQDQGTIMRFTIPTVSKLELSDAH